MLFSHGRQTYGRTALRISASSCFRRQRDSLVPCQRQDLLQVPYRSVPVAGDQIELGPLHIVPGSLGLQLDNSRHVLDSGDQLVDLEVNHSPVVVRVGELGIKLDSLAEGEHRGVVVLESRVYQTTVMVCDSQVRLKLRCSGQILQRTGQIPKGVENIGAASVRVGESRVTVNCISVRLARLE